MQEHDKRSVHGTDARIRIITNYQLLITDKNGANPKSKEGKMAVQVIEGNALGGFEQEFFKKTVLRDRKESRLSLSRMQDSDREFGFDTISITDDRSIKKMLLRVSASDLIISLYGSDRATREAIFRNLPAKTENHIKIILNRLETGNALEMLVDRSRNMISEAFIEMIRE